MTIQKGKKVYYDGEDALEGFLARPQSEKKLPTVVIFPAFMGITDFEEGRAKALAKIGFVAFAADIYGRQNRPKTKEEGFGHCQEYVKNRSTKLLNRTKAAIEFVKTLPYVDPQKINAIGYCFGGTAVIDLCRMNVDIRSAVSFHGSFIPMDPPAPTPKPITTKLLICHGDEDERVNKEVDHFITELRERKVDFQFIRYAFAKHGFTVPDNRKSEIPGVDYNEIADHRSGRAMLMLFHELYSLPKFEDFAKYEK